MFLVNYKSDHIQVRSSSNLVTGLSLSIDLCLNVLQIINQEINPYVDKWEEEGQFPAHKIFKILGSAGFLGVNKPVGKQTFATSDVP